MVSVERCFSGAGKICFLSLRFCTQRLFYAYRNRPSARPRLPVKPDGWPTDSLHRRGTFTTRADTGTDANFVSYWPQPQHCWLWRCLEVSDNVEDQQNNNNKRLGVSEDLRVLGRLKHCGHTARDSFRSLSRLERERGVERANALRASLKRPSLIRQTLELFQKATSGKLLKRSWAFPSAYL